MAVDTRDKRFSMIGIANGRGASWVMPNPDGANFATNSERAQMIYQYYGLPGQSGKPTMTYWKGTPHVRVGPSAFGRSW